MGMAGLGEEAFSASGTLMTVGEAVAELGRRVIPLAGVERVPLVEADGRVLAEDVASAVSLPRFDNSAMDGWAVRSADLSVAGPTRLPARGRIAAGHSAASISAEGCAVRIFTGAPVPDDADLVIMQEDAGREGTACFCPLSPAAPATSGVPGRTWRWTQIVLRAGRRLRPQDVALAAAAGRSAVLVRKALRVALFSTGDEVCEPGSALGPGAIFDSNRVLLSALLRRSGAAVTDLGILADERTSLARRLSDAAASHDVVITSGGVSMGEEDHVRAAVESVGSLAFWKLAIKPGRPVALGVIGGTPFVGLPGNPVAAFITYAHIARPLLALLAAEDRPALAGQPVRAGFSYRKPEGRRDFIRVRLAPGPDGMLEALKHPHDGASSLTSLSETAGLLVLEEAVTEVAPGLVAPFIPYADLW